MLISETCEEPTAQASDRLRGQPFRRSPTPRRLSLLWWIQCRPPLAELSSVGQDEGAASAVVVQPVTNQSGQIACRWCGLFSDPGPACDLCGSPLLDVPWLQVPQLMYPPADASVDSPQIIAPAAPPEPPVAAQPAAQPAATQQAAPAEKAIQVAAPAVPVLDAATEEAHRRALLGRLWPREPAVVPDEEDKATAAVVDVDQATTVASPPAEDSQVDGDIDLTIAPPGELEEIPVQPKPRWWRRGRKDSGSDEEIFDEARTESLPEIAEQVPLPPAAGDAPTPSEERASGGEKRSIIESVDSLADLEGEAADEARLQERLRHEEEARLRAEEEARLRAEEEARVKAEEEARVKAEEDARLRAEETARLRAEEEARLRAEEEARAKAEEEARAKAEEEARAKAEEEARAKAEEQARVDEKARVAKEAKLRAREEARLRAEAEKEARAEAEKEARLRAVEESRLKAEEEARVRAEARARAEEEARLRAQAQEEARARAEEEARTKAEEEARLRAEEEVRAQDRAVGQPNDDVLRATLMQEMLGLGAERRASKMPAAAGSATETSKEAPAWSDPTAAASPEVTSSAARSIPSPQPQQEEKKRSKLPWKKAKRKRGETEGAGRPAAAPIEISATSRFQIPAVAPSNGAVYGVPRVGDPALSGPGPVLLVCSRCGQPSPGGGLCEACEDALSQLRQLTAALLDADD
jgi:hypothetical protein